MTLTRLYIVLAIIVSLTSFYLSANPTPEILENYHLAADGNEDMVDKTHEQLTQLVEKEGAKPVSMVYLGSTQTMRGRDALLPWNKMKHVEQGLATIAKGLRMLDSLPEDINQQERIQGLPEIYIAQAMAAVTYTSMPEIFNHFERGYDLYLELLNNPKFVEQPFSASAWVYLQGIQAALKAQDLPQAQTWLATMLSLDPASQQTQAAQQLIAENS